MQIHINNIINAFQKHSRYFSLKILQTFHPRRITPRLSRYRFFTCNFDMLFGKLRSALELLFTHDTESHIANSILVQERTAILLHANRICKHHIVIFGTEYDFSETINWHNDIPSGVAWPLRFQLDLKPISINDASDVKFIWELNRFHHSVVLGQAYLISGNERFVREFELQTTHWIECNPVNTGINWQCAMEVAIRAVNLIWAYRFCIDHPKLTEQFHCLFLNCMYEHGNFIWNNLENRGTIRGNHYIANLVGLLYIGICFPVFRDAQKWTRFAICNLRTEIAMQIESDGVNFEGSIYYHRFVTEMLLHVIILMKKYGLDRNWEENERESIKAMCDFTLSYIKPDGTAPQIGDNDAGRLIKFSADEYGGADYKHHHILCVAGVLFDRDDYKSAGSKSNDAMWLFNGMVKSESAIISYPQSQKFQISGFYILRHFNDYLILRCAGLATGGKGTHSHNDALSFELCAHKTTFIIDPGTYNYARDRSMRNLFRSTAYHNTIVIDDHEQNRFDVRDPFRLYPAIHCHLLEWSVSTEYDRIAGEAWYTNDNLNIKHRREIVFNKMASTWKICDNINGKGVHCIKWYFHTANDVRIEVSSKSAYFRHENGEILTLNWPVNIESIFSVSPFQYSPSYDRLAEGQVLCILAKVELSLAVEFNLICSDTNDM